MNRKRILGLWLVLLMLTMTACGKSKDTVLEAIQESAESSKVEGAEPEDQEQSGAQIDETEIQDNSEINKAPKPQADVPEAQADESEPQVSGIENSQEAVNDNRKILFTRQNATVLKCKKCWRRHLRLILN